MPAQTKRLATDAAIVAVLGLLVLVPALELLHRPLEWDERTNYEWHLQGNLWHVLTTQVAATNQLGFSLLAWLSIHVFGPEPWALRLPSLLAAMLFPGVFYLVSRTWVGSAGALTVAVAACGWNDLGEVAVQARSYSLLILGGLLHHAVWQRFLRRPTARIEVRHAVTLGLTATCHLWILLAGAAEAAAIVVLGWFRAARHAIDPDGRVRVRTRQIYTASLLGFTLAATLQAGLAPKYFVILTQGDQASWQPADLVPALLRGVSGFAYSAEPEMTHPGSDRLLSAHPVALLLVLIGAGVSIRRARHDRDARLDAAWLVFLLGFSAIAVLAAHPTYMYARFWLFGIVPLFWLSARGWQFVWQSLTESSRR